MPEIPELIMLAKTLEKDFKGETVKRVDFQWTKKLNVSEDEVISAIKASKLKSVVRDGKELLMQFDNGNILAIHLMLTGKMFLLPTEQKITKPIFSLEFSNGAGIAVSDMLGQARAVLNPEKSEISDILSKDFTLDQLENILNKTTRKIKTVLTDQKKIKGIGNAYVDEILWHVKISPFSSSKKIPKVKVRELFEAIPKVTKEASAAIAKRNNSEDIFAMKIKDHRFIHNSQRTHSPDGEEIIVGKVGQAKTFYTNSQVKY